MNSKQVRQLFLDFFRSKNHLIIPSAPVIVRNDPTLMFTNAGMNQFKDVFLGNASPQAPRIADTQKCLRVSGKHNDLEDVGLDTYHHTFFEMLGNWSFGDYFKNEAISWAWELLTQVYKIPPERLYATYFEGDRAENLEEDLDSKKIWLEFLPDSRVIPGNKKDNFWEMGETGPCGPCSEIHVDLRDESDRQKVSGHSLVNKNHPLVLEIWNLVFIQFDRNAQGKLRLLPQKHIDTGMGLERLCMVLQGKRSNYDTDLFSGFIIRLEELSGKKYGVDPRTDVAFRAISDHIRAVGSCIADGQLPSNNGAGYVVRRILRRAVRYGFSLLDFKQPFFHSLVEVLGDNLGDYFPEFKSQQKFIEKIIFEEEKAFFRTIEKGLGRLMDAFRQTSSSILPGKIIFELYDTYGFPADLTELIAREEGYLVDMNGFQHELAQQKTRSRKATEIKAGDWIEIHPYDKPLFVGYDQLKTSSKILKYREVKIGQKQQIHLVIHPTPFYPEGGGQVGDIGWLSGDQEKVKITNTIKENELIIHVAESLPSRLHAVFEAEVDTERRKRAAMNHTATHLLHAALRQVLGPHVEQRGSLVHPDYLRFDFSHPHKIQFQELHLIEIIVNERIRANLPREEFKDIDSKEAIRNGAIALFGEKYGEKVRMIRFGADYSTELCGGTHVEFTGQIGCFKIISETSIASGVRRIEAITGQKSLEYVQQLEEDWQKIKRILKTGDDPIRHAEQIMTRLQNLEKKIELLKEREIQSISQNIMNDLKIKKNFKFGAFLLDDMDAETLRHIAFKVKNRSPQTILVLGSVQHEKPILTVMVTEDLLNSDYNAIHLINKWAPLIEGKGGGQPFLATAGGKNASALIKLIQNSESWFEE